MIIDPSNEILPSYIFLYVGNIFDYLLIEYEIGLYLCYQDDDDKIRY